MRTQLTARHPAGDPDRVVGDGHGHRGGDRDRMAREGGIGIIHKNMHASPSRRSRSRRSRRRRAGVVVNPVTVGPEQKLAAAARADAAPRDLRPAGRRGRRPPGRHPHQPRHPLRAQPRPAGQRDDDEGAHHDRRGHDARGGQGAPAQEPHREAAGDRRRRPAQGPGHDQGHREGAAAPVRGQGRASAACAWARRSASGPTATSASTPCSRRAATSSASTPRTGTRAASSRRSPTCAATSPRRRSSPATSRRARARWRWPRPAPTPSRSASAPDRSARRASSPASACRRSRAITDCAQGAARRRTSTVIADGGIKYSGDVAKAIAAGAHTRHDRQPVRRHRRGAGRDHPLPGPQLQGVPRHGLDRRDARRQPRPLLPGRGDQRRQARARGHRGPRARTAGRCRSRSTS